MNITSNIAFRYLVSGRKDGFFGFISVLSVMSVAIAIAAMIVVLSVINGFETNLRDRFLAANAHVLLYKFPSGIKDPDRWIESVYKNHGEEITGASPFIHMETMGKNNTLLNSVLIRGIHPSKREKVQPLKNLIRPASALDILEKEMASRDTDSNPSVILGIVSYGLFLFSETYKWAIFWKVISSENSCAFEPFSTNLCMHCTNSSY